MSARGAYLDAGTLSRVTELLTSLGDHVGNVDPRSGVDRCEVLLALRRASSEDLAVPAVHLNGTSREELERQLEAVSGHLRSALTALADACPHGRDYYPQGDGAFRLAMGQHDSRSRRLLSVLEELALVHEGIADRTGGRP